IVYVPYHAATNPEYLATQNRLGGPPVARLDGPRFLGQQRHLRQLTAELRIPFLDTTAAFVRAERGGGREFWPVDGPCTAARQGRLRGVLGAYRPGGEIPRAGGRGGAAALLPAGGGGVGVFLPPAAPR